MIGAPVAAVLTAGLAVSARLPADCDIATVKNDSELYYTLARRAVDLVQRAGRAGWSKDDILGRQVTPSAESGLGAGDVGRPLGKGASGLHALAIMMNADRFKYPGWSSMSGPVDACKERTVEIEFIDTPARRSSSVRFTFVAGKITRAAGWQGSYESGAMTPVDKEVLE